MNLETEIQDIAVKIKEDVEEFFIKVLLMEQDFCDEYLGNYITGFNKGLHNMLESVEDCGKTEKEVEALACIIVRGFIKTVDTMTSEETYVCQTMDDFIHFLFMRFCRKHFVTYLVEHAV